MGAVTDFIADENDRIVNWRTWFQALQKTAMRSDTVASMLNKSKLQSLKYINSAIEKVLSGDLKAAEEAFNTHNRNHDRVVNGINLVINNPHYSSDFHMSNLDSVMTPYHDTVQHLRSKYNFFKSLGVN